MRLVRVLPLVALAVAIGLVVVVVTVRSSAERRVTLPAPAEPGLAGRITEYLAAQHPEQPYRDPTGAERLAAAAALDDRSRFAELGFTTLDGVDDLTGRPFALYSSALDDRAWGLVLVDLSQPGASLGDKPAVSARLAIEVPHPRTDIGTEWIGLDLFRAVPGSVLLIAGANRRAAAELADVAHNENSVYQALSVALARSGVPQVQLHGFADLNLPDHDIAVSTGTDQPNALAMRVADGLAESGFDECRAWAQRCGRLEGTTNVQAKAAAAHGAAFAHVELSNKIRRDDEQRADLVRSLAGTLT
jgi:hypothetical protein